MTAKHQKLALSTPLTLTGELGFATLKATMLGMIMRKSTHATGRIAPETIILLITKRSKSR